MVLDEVHMLSDDQRGYLLELFLSKIQMLGKDQQVLLLLFVIHVSKCRFQTSLMFSISNAQVVCMSATLPNIDVIAKWIDAALFITSFRPVPLREMVCDVYRIYFVAPPRKHGLT